MLQEGQCVIINLILQSVTRGTESGNYLDILECYRRDIW